MNIKTIIVVLLILGAVVTGTYYMVNSMAAPDAYNIQVDSSYSSSFDATQNLSNDISVKYSRIQNLTTETGANIFIISLVPQSLMILKDLLVLPFSAIGGVLTSISTILGLPPWVFTFMIAMVGIIFIFAFIKAVLGREA